MDSPAPHPPHHPLPPHPLTLPETRANPETFVRTLSACLEKNQEVIIPLAHYILDRQNQDQPIDPRELDYLHEEIDAYGKCLLGDGYRQRSLDEWSHLRDQFTYERTRQYLLAHYDMRALFQSAIQAAHKMHCEQGKSANSPCLFSLMDRDNLPRYALKMIRWNLKQGESADPALLLPPGPPRIFLDGKYLREILDLVKKLYGQEKFSEYSHRLRNELDPIMRLGYHDKMEEDQGGFKLTRLFAEIEAEIVSDQQRRQTAEAARDASVPDDVADNIPDDNK
jgi:hypothetical protein